MVTSIDILEIVVLQFEAYFSIKRKPKWPGIQLYFQNAPVATDPVVRVSVDKVHFIENIQLHVFHMVHSFIRILIHISDKCEQDKVVSSTLFFVRIKGFGPSGITCFNYIILSLNLGAILLGQQKVMRKAAPGLSVLFLGYILHQSDDIIMQWYTELNSGDISMLCSIIGPFCAWKSPLCHKDTAELWVP